MPDDHPTVQAAIDSGADTVVVREGDYSESPEAYRGVTLLGLGVRRPRLDGLAITNPYSWLSLSWDVRGIDFAGPVTVTTTNWQARYLDISFDHCALPDGLQHDIQAATDPYDIFMLSVTHCRLGSGSTAMAARVTMVSDTIASGVKLLPAEVVDIQSCWFNGGSGAALTLENQEPSGLIEGNIVEGYQHGIVVANSNGLTIRNNHIRNMTENGILVLGYGGTISGNTVTGCQVGIRSNFEDIVFNDNVILHSRGVGAWFDTPTTLQAERNVIGQCGDTGVLIEIGTGGTYELVNNTVFENAGSGVSLPFGSNNRVTLTGNILYANARWGLQIGPPLRSLTLSCNDWFSNGLGPLLGSPIGSSDLELNPNFCDVDNDDVRLYSDSRLLSQAQCLQIGARGVGCSPPSLEFASIVSSSAGLEVSWAFDAASSVESWLERANQSTGRWDSLGTGSSTGSNSFELLDRAVAPDHAYNYRVVWRDRGAIVHGSPFFGTWSDAGRLSSVSPNPSRGEVNIDWVLARPGSTDIRVYDLAGREVSVVARGSFDVGRHQARWDGHWDGRGVAPAGMYIVRISNGERTTSHRILLLR